MFQKFVSISRLIFRKPRIDEEHCFNSSLFFEKRIIYLEEFENYSSKDPEICFDFSSSFFTKSRNSFNPSLSFEERIIYLEEFNLKIIRLRIVPEICFDLSANFYETEDRRGIALIHPFSSKKGLFIWKNLIWKLFVQESRNLFRSLV